MPTFRFQLLLLNKLSFNAVTGLTNVIACKLQLKHHQTPKAPTFKRCKHNCRVVAHSTHLGLQQI